MSYIIQFCSPDNLHCCYMKENFLHSKRKMITLVRFADSANYKKRGFDPEINSI